MTKKAITAAEIAALLGGELHGDPALVLERPAPLEEACASEFSFSDERGRDEAVAASGAGLVLVEQKVLARSGAQLVIAGPRAAFFRLVSERFVVRPDLSRSRIADSARLADDVVLGEGVQIGDFVSIGAGSRIGNRVQIKPGAVLAEDVTIGDDSVIHALVSLRSGTRIGARTTIHDGSVIGADGFGYLPTATGLMKVPQIGRVVIEDEVEIGAQVCIDRATLGETRIGRGSKIDNLVQIAHNVKIGPMSIIVSQVGISGSTSIGAQAMIGGQVGIVGHLKIGDRVRIGAQSGVGHDLEDGAEVLGSPAYDKRKSIRTAMTLPKLPEMRSQLRRLEERLKALEDQ